MVAVDDSEGSRKPVSYCNITVTYTHPGWNDTIHTDIVLPLDVKDWNGRFLGQGGGGFKAGQADGGLLPVVAQGFAAATTDAGHDKEALFAGKDVWRGFFTSPGNINLHLLQDFGFRAIEDLPIIGKQVVESFYGRKINYSYWNGCSTGGRQGFMAAQRFPEAYDGILTAAPAIKWASLLVTIHWAHLVMNNLKTSPSPCEFEAITGFAITACDELDGVKDGIISARHLCKYDAKDAIGVEVPCGSNGRKRKISPEAAEIANAFWTGPVDSKGKQWWSGSPHETHLYNAAMSYFGGLGQTMCAKEEEQEDCHNIPFTISEQWIRYFVQKDPDYDHTTMTTDGYFSIWRKSINEYYSSMDAGDPDLTPFRDAGGKLLMWHGNADQLIPIDGSRSYYEAVGQETRDPNIRDWFRYFEAPGVLHCFGGKGPYPFTALESLVDWVEKGKAPEMLDAVTVPNEFTPEVEKISRPLCPYPLVASYKGGDARKKESYECKETFSEKTKATIVGAKATLSAGKDEL
ncbi:tannase and feruloyl esterase [Polychaeton citri CBS 116435]|uniref:Carboxylic ester hydrolase n=1 Tax=Polychaeton citri CBS 116435 TaxID=1314669 RepID=A0A9P4QEE2_9PEZI|nr:tannase and feruloyl esterase [Polychaeton citri CBS 116435]